MLIHHQTIMHDLVRLKYLTTLGYSKTRFKAKLVPKSDINTFETWFNIAKVNPQAWKLTAGVVNYRQGSYLTEGLIIGPESKTLCAGPWKKIRELFFIEKSHSTKNLSWKSTPCFYAVQNCKAWKKHCQISFHFLVHCIRISLKVVGV